MSNFFEQTVLDVHHWNDTLFSFKVDRPASLRFESGHFLMLGLVVDGKPLTRAYSIASASYDEHLEFLSIKAPDGALTKRLQNIRSGDALLIGRKPVGTLVLDDLRPGKRLYLFASGTGLAPFMSVIRNPEVYERFETVILVHSVRRVSELAYSSYIEEQLPQNEFLGEAISRQLRYYPTVTREPFRNRGRITDLIDSGKLFDDLGQPPLDPDCDRAMLCGSASLLADLCTLLDARGMRISPRQGEAGDYVIERAFVET